MICAATCRTIAFPNVASIWDSVPCAPQEILAPEIFFDETDGAIPPPKGSKGEASDSREEVEVGFFIHCFELFCFTLNHFKSKLSSMKRLMFELMVPVGGLVTGLVIGWMLDLAGVL